MPHVQRYNQGFGSFGPLEKCDTGKLAYYEDMANENRSLRIGAMNAVEELVSKLEDARTTIKEVETRYFDTLLELEQAKLALKTAHSKNRAKTWYLTAIVALCIGGIVAWLSARGVF